MRRPPSQSNRPFRPCDLEQHLSRYALAAAAAGVGILAPIQSSEAEVVYTPAHQQIAPNTTIKIDLNHDGIADFAIKDTFSTTFFSSFGRVGAVPLQSQNKVWGHTVSQRAYASALFSGALIGPKGQFLPGTGAMAEVSFLGGKRPMASASCTEPWGNVTHRYLGLKFVVAGEVHFGWARLDVQCLANNSSAIGGLLTGYAYETRAGRPIFTGQESGTADVDDPSWQPGPAVLQPATLGRLAQGASGLAAWRGKP